MAAEAEEMVEATVSQILYGGSKPPPAATAEQTRPALADAAVVGHSGGEMHPKVVGS